MKQHAMTFGQIVEQGDADAIVNSLDFWKGGMAAVAGRINVMPGDIAVKVLAHIESRAPDILDRIINAPNTWLTSTEETTTMTRLSRLASFRRLVLSYTALREYHPMASTGKLDSFFRLSGVFYADFNRTLTLFGVDAQCMCGPCVATRQRVIRVLSRLSAPESRAVTKTYVHIPTAGRPTPIAVNEHHDELEVLQKAVGGYIEAVGIDDHTLYVNEEGKISGLPFNLIATDLTRGVLSPFDLIVGDAILVGPLDAEGDNTSVDPRLLAALCGEGVTR